jgi:hypothetical protein
MMGRNGMMVDRNSAERTSDGRLNRRHIRLLVITTLVAGQLPSV